MEEYQKKRSPSRANKNTGLSFLTQKEQEKLSTEEIKTQPAQTHSSGFSLADIPILQPAEQDLSNAQISSLSGSKRQMQEPPQESKGETTKEARQRKEGRETTSIGKELQETTSATNQTEQQVPIKTLINMASSHRDYFKKLEDRGREGSNKLRVIRSVVSGNFSSRKDPQTGKIDPGLSTAEILDNLSDDVETFYEVLDELQNTTGEQKESDTSHFPLYRSLKLPPSAAAKLTVGSEHVERLPSSTSFSFDFVKKKWATGKNDAIFEIQTPVNYPKAILSYPGNSKDIEKLPSHINQNQQEVTLPPTSLKITGIGEREGKQVYTATPTLISSHATLQEIDEAKKSREDMDRKGVSREKPAMKAEKGKNILSSNMNKMDHFLLEYWVMMA